MPDKVLTPLRDDNREGWTIISNDDGSSLLTKDGEHYFQVTLDGCSCGKSRCIHQKLIYPTPPPPPRPPAVHNPNVDILHVRPAFEDEEKEPKPSSKPFHWPTDNTMLIGLLTVMLVVSTILRFIGWLCTVVGDALDWRQWTPE